MAPPREKIRWHTRAAGPLAQPLNGHGRGMGMTERTDTERCLNATLRWFTPGMGRNIALADDLFSEILRTNGALAGTIGRNAGYKSDWRASPV
jgi:hypothetical protein